MLEGLSPRALMIGMLVVSLVYLVLPFDFIPDFLGLPGRIDDVALIGFLVWLYQRRSAAHVERETHEAESRQKDSSSRSSGPASESSRAFDPYTVLGIDRSASDKEIQSAYRARMQEYHPDKVSHLGEELQRVAHDKSQEIQLAYRQLKK
ncbi:MAG: hypothetical protein CBC48_19240 [bacterium TMED88]|nr:hypothetical protein [Deltaproteobacteria bacterium]OUV23096.1 MAG: hypothetical protein CBC48_19240 [bacterium TMED88]